MSAGSYEEVKSKSEEEEEEKGLCMIDSIRNDAAFQLTGMLQISRDDAYDLIDSSLRKLPIQTNSGNYEYHQKMALLESVMDDAMTSHFDSKSNFQRSSSLPNSGDNQSKDACFKNEESLSCEWRKRKRREDETSKSSANKTKKIIKAKPTTTSRPHTLGAYFTIKNDTKHNKSTDEEIPSITSNAESKNLCINKLKTNYDDDDDDVIIIESVESKGTKQSAAKDIEKKKSLGPNNNIKYDEEDVLKTKHTTDLERNFGRQDFDAYQLAQNYLLQNNKHHTKTSLSPPFLHLCEALSLVCATTKRLKKEHILTDFFLTLLYFDRAKHDTKHNNQNEKQTENRESAALQALLICGDVALHGYKLNVGHSTISQSLCVALSCSSSTLKQRINTTGEMGDAAASIFLGISEGSSNSAQKHLKQTRLNWNISKSKSLDFKDIFRCILDLHSMSKQGGKGIETKKKVKD